MPILVRVLIVLLYIGGINIVCLVSFQTGDETGPAADERNAADCSGFVVGASLLFVCGSSRLIRL